VGGRGEAHPEGVNQGLGLRWALSLSAFAAKGVQITPLCDSQHMNLEMSRAIIEVSQALGFGPVGRRTNMKTWRGLVAVLVMLVATLLSAAWQKPPGNGVPKYDKSTEATFKGTVEEVKDRHCPVSSGTGSHLMLKQADGTVIEVHLALTKFVTQYELVFQKGDVLEVTGVKVKFEGADTIFARKIKRGNDEFLFRDGDGKPLW
jgi:hypothetical protein